MRSPFPPAWAWQREPELRLLRAFVVIVAAHAGDVDAMVAAYESVLLREEAREQGRLSAADRRRAGRPIYVMSDQLRALFGQPDPIRSLIGAADPKGRWEPGLAALTPAEQEAYWHHLHGSSRAAIALMMATTRARRFGRAGAVPLDTVSKYLWRARAKLRVVFALPAEAERAYLAGLDAEEADAERLRRDVDASRVIAEELARTGYRPDFTEGWQKRWEGFPDGATPAEARPDEPPILDPLDDEENPPEDRFLP